MHTQTHIMCMLIQSYCHVSKIPNEIDYVIDVPFFLIIFPRGDKSGPAFLNLEKNEERGRKVLWGGRMKEGKEGGKENN